MANLTFLAAYSTTYEGVMSETNFSEVYAEDLGNCQHCIDIVGSCWACLTTNQQIFSDPGLTTPVVDGYYRVEYFDETYEAVWHVVGGYPQPGGFNNG